MCGGRPSVTHVVVDMRRTQNKVMRHHLIFSRDIHSWEEENFPSVPSHEEAIEMKQLESNLIVLCPKSIAKGGGDRESERREVKNVGKRLIGGVGML